ncbi:nicotinamide mononucleotide transporter [Patescibacteria group bacterium]|nr:nicotinamide mononucleotide transporter [Patescibacteria group bacterium]
MKKIIYWFAVVVSVVLIYASWKGIIPFGLTEMLGFVTGGWTVWLTVKENIWNWPIGILNSIFFLILFLKARLFADSGLQVVYVVFGFLGWYWWLYGGKDKTELPVQNVTKRTAFILAFLTLAFTWIMTIYLRKISDVSPFLDALTTVLSLVAQYLLTKKYIENWYIWITADVIYIYLYAYKNLYLTSILYFIFLCMCIQGVLEWKRSQDKMIFVEPAIIK